MIRSRNIIVRNNNSNNNSNKVRNYYNDNNAGTHLGYLDDGTSTASQMEHQQPVEPEPLTMAKTTAKKAAADHSYRQTWRQSAAVSYQQAQPVFNMPTSDQQPPHYLKLQYPGAAQPPTQKSAFTSYALVRALRGVSDVKMATEAFESQKQPQLIPAAKSHSLARNIRRIRRPRQWVPPLKRLSRIVKPALGENLGVLSKGRAFIVEFLQGSSIHGFIYLAKIGLSIMERMLWLAFICVALYAIISLSARTWERFQTSPMVISMDRNKLVWNTSFPSLTVCPHKRIDEFKVDEYMDAHPETFQSDDDRDDFRVFIEKLARLTYENIETLPRNKSFGIPSSMYLDLLYELKWDFQPEMSSGAAVQMFIYETLTEFGICHSVNSLVARYNSYDYWKRNDWSMLEHGDRVTVHPLDGEIYAQLINLSTAYDVYFHGALDIPNISKQRYTFPESDYTTVELIALETFTTEDARAFTTKQRKCRYQYEAEEMQTSPIYSFGLCITECRMFFALKVCGCVPHFYRNHLKNGRVLRICDLDELACLEDIKREIISLKSSRYKIDCQCLSNCDDSNFFVQSYRSRVWFLGANLQWGIIDYPKMQLKRDVLFSFADVLVYIGGLIGFFLGCSALSFTEVIYFFTARLIKRIFWN